MIASSGPAGATQPSLATITCCQLTPMTADLEANERLTTAAIRAAVDDGADVVVLPELATSGYSLAAPGRIADSGITPQHAMFDAWARHAGSAVVVGGFCERADDGQLFNSAAVVDATGVLAVHRKTHPWAREREVFASGSRPPPVVDTPVGRIGVLICYEMEFPEMTRAIAMAGAQLLAVPTNWPLVPRPAGERPPEVVMAMAAARANRIAIACCDRGGAGFTGGSSIIDPAGWVVGSVRDGLASTEIDLSEADDKTLGPGNDALGDRRPELYGHGGASITSTGTRTDLPAPSAAQRAPGSSRHPLVLLPGMLGGADTWNDVARLLLDVAEPRVTRIDLDDSIEEMAATVLAQAPQRFALAGHSLGAIVALEVVRRAPSRVLGLAVLNSSARAGSDDQQRAWGALRRRLDAEPFPTIAAAMARANLPRHRRDDHDLVGRGEAMARRVGADGLRRQLAAQASRPDSLPTLPGITVPTVVVSGDADEVCPPGLQEELAGLLPHADHVVLEDVGHMAPMEDPRAVAAVLQAWLDGPVTRASR